MNFEWARRRARGLAAVAVVVMSMGAAAGSAFGQAKSADTAARLQKIEDRQAIEQLLMGDYPRALDSNDWAAYAALFTKDGTLIMNGTTKRTGHTAIQELFSTFPRLASTAEAASPCPAPAGAHRTMHVVSNLSLQIDGDTATDQAYWETIATRDCKSVVAGSGHYEDVLKREDGKWRFFERKIFDEFPPRTVTPPAPAAPAAPKP